MWTVEEGEEYGIKTWGVAGDKRFRWHARGLGHGGWTVCFGPVAMTVPGVWRGYGVQARTMVSGGSGVFQKCTKSCVILELIASALDWLDTKYN